MPRPAASSGNTCGSRRASAGSAASASTATWSTWWRRIRRSSRSIAGRATRIWEARPSQAGKRFQGPMPFAAKGLIIMSGSGQGGGFIEAFDALTGKPRWSWNAIPKPGEPGNETWAGDSWRNGGGPVWVSGSYDPAAQPHLLGNRPALARLRRRQPRGRQPLHRQHRRARHRHRQDEVALPEHAARRARLGFARDAGAARCAVQRADAQAAAAGQPQRRSTTSSIARTGSSSAACRSSARWTG